MPPLDDAGVRNDATGIRSFVLGMGGKNHYRLDPGAAANRLWADDTAFGVLALELSATGYTWRFLADDGRLVDAGSGTCH